MARNATGYTIDLLERTSPRDFLKLLIEACEVLARPEIQKLMARLIGSAPDYPKLIECDLLDGRSGDPLFNEEFQGRTQDRLIDQRVPRSALCHTEVAFFSRGAHSSSFDALRHTPSTRARQGAHASLYHLQHVK
jgi:hypothetical protein